jgi:hypothetical protein
MGHGQFQHVSYQYKNMRIHVAMTLYGRQSQFLNSQSDCSVESIKHATQVTKSESNIQDMVYRKARC